MFNRKENYAQNNKKGTLNLLLRYVILLICTLDTERSNLLQVCRGFPQSFKYLDKYLDLCEIWGFHDGEDDDAVLSFGAM
jgi:hypothetical protein